MTTKLSNLFYTFLNIAASTQKLGINSDPRGNPDHLRMDRRIEIL